MSKAKIVLSKIAEALSSGDRLHPVEIRGGVRTGGVPFKSEKDIPEWKEIVANYNKKFKPSFIQGYYGSVEWGGSTSSDDVQNLLSIIKEMGLDYCISSTGYNGKTKWYK